MESQSLHCKEELELIILLKELRSILESAINSLAHQTPPSIDSRYIVHAAKAINFASDSYIFLREAGKVHTSKMMIRPMIETVTTAIAVEKNKGYFFRVAYTELQKAKKLYDATPENNAKAKEEEERLKMSFSREPNYPIVLKQIDAKVTADAAGLAVVYRSAYAIYCEFTHNALRAINGDLDEATDHIDTLMVIWAVEVMLNQLKKFTPAVIPDLSAFNARVQKAQDAMFKIYDKPAGPALWT
ncbi:MAG TPA: DUF5677 domain-containing protein [Verrucomicrobiae bacterium]|jgi:hypothetical protein|nr:DUF5677 domain-containing protein [Verrucomicrobiae bacterium]